MDRDDRLLIDGALTASVMVLFLASLYAVLRLGFGTPLTDLVGVVALGLFLVGFPAAWRTSIRTSNDGGNARWIGSAGFGIFVAILFVVLVSLIRLSPSVNRALFVVAAVAVQSVLIRRWRSISPTRFWEVLAIAALITAWSAGVLWASGYLDPLYIENLALHGGSIHIDPMYHAALTNMVTVYKSVSMGIDGPISFHYHYGSHWLFGGVSRSLGMPAVMFYQLGYVVIVAPLFFFAFVALVNSAKRLWSQSGVDGGASIRVVSAGFLVAVLGVLPAGAMTGVGVWPNGPLLSESYGLALVGLFALSILALDYWRYSNPAVETTRRFSPIEWLLFVIGVPAIVAAIALTKISVGALAVVLLFFVVWRLPKLHRPPVLLGLLTTALAFGAVFLAVSIREEGSFALFNFARSYVQREWLPFFVSLHFLWALLYLIARLEIAGVRSWADLRISIRERRIVDAEAVLILAVFGAAPGAIIDVGSDAFYFSDVQRWIALAALIGCTPVIVRVLSRWNAFRGTGFFSVEPKKLFALVFGLPVLISMCFNLWKFDYALLRANLDTRHEVLALVSDAPQVALRRGGQLRKLFRGAELQQGMQRAVAMPLVAALQNLNSLPESERRVSALFIAQDNPVFWKLPPKTGLCRYAPFMGPALSGMTLINGQPPLGCPLSHTFGQMVFRNRTSPQTFDDTQSPALCGRARQFGLSRVYALRTDSASAVRVERLECSQITSAVN